MKLVKNCSKCGQSYDDQASFCAEDGFPLVLVKAAEKAEISADYEVLQLIAQGGMGAVYKARHKRMDRIVAVKLLLADISKDPQAMMRFQVEARAASVLSHPNIVTIYEFAFNESGLPYLVMEHLEGATLQETLQRQKQLPWQTAVPLFMQMGAALRHAHKRNVLHRDLKPSNVMLLVDDNERTAAKLLDFGIAKLFAVPGKTAMRLTQTGEVFGSPVYMSPEQCMGQTIDPRSDIYSFGCLMYEVLAGVAPLSGNSLVALVYAHLHNDPKPLRKASALVDVPEQLEEIVHKAMKKAPDDRYQSADELVKELEKFFFQRLPAAGFERVITVSGGTPPSIHDPAHGADARQKNIASGITSEVPPPSSASTGAETSDAEVDSTPNAADAGNGDWSTESDIAAYKEGQDRLIELEKKATAGDATAQYELACLFNEGSLYERDLNKAYYWHHQAAEQQHAPSVCWVGVCHRDGHGVAQNYAKAVKFFQQGANLGDAQSQCYLAQMYESGRAGKVDFDMAAYWHRKAAEKDFVPSIAALAKFYASGTGVDTNPKRAAAWFLKGAEKGDAECQFEIANRYGSGNGVNESASKSASWYLCAAEQGHGLAKVAIAQCYEKGDGVPQNEQEALMWMKCAAEAGVAEAQYWLGIWYERGAMGLEQSDRKAWMWMSKAAMKNDSWAQVKMGFYALYGTGMRQNEKQAVVWLRRAAEQGRYDAQYKLGQCYKEGWGIEKNERQHKYWLEKAADNGSHDALIELGRPVPDEKKSEPSDRNRLGRLYEHFHRNNSNETEVEETDDVGDEELEQDEYDQSLHKTIRDYLRRAKKGQASDMYDLACHYRSGDIVKKSLKRAIYWFLKAGEAGDLDGMIYAGELYRDGSGSVEKDLEKAFALFQRTADKGGKRGMTYLGDAYAYGEGVAVDAEQALEWYKKGAEKGDPLAMKRLASCHENGFGVERSLEGAADWWLQAAQKGDKHAQYWIGVCYREGIGVPVDHVECVTWLECSARQKYCLGKIELARCYEEGLGVERHAQDARDLLQQAADDGCPQAAQKLQD